MKNTAIEDLYYCRRGNISCIKSSEEYLKMVKEACELFDKLLNTIDDDNKKVLEKAWDLCVDMEAESSLENFKEGFRMGLLIGAECFGN